ncbi:hypothetical protein PanWU01x14_336870 [Parasponia andersonii]|uniref:Uncharacterized protein n=1 Tax=Parasponia andersonii TaxID=3476 RepID=A0A2P5AFS8_PARAD|nr:hypothetical protein PanWU01x14_336870 [Parasponia andersonii]
MSVKKFSVAYNGCNYSTQIRLQGRRAWGIPIPNDCSSWSWRKLLNLRDTMRALIRSKVGNERSAWTRIPPLMRSLQSCFHAKNPLYLRRLEQNEGKRMVPKFFQAIKFTNIYSSVEVTSRFCWLNVLHLRSLHHQLTMIQLLLSAPINAFFLSYPNLNLPVQNKALNLPEVPCPFLSAASTSSSSLTSTVTLSMLPSPLPAVSPSSLASETLLSSVSNQAPNFSISASTFSASLSYLSPSTTSSDISTILHQYLTSLIQFLVKVCHTKLFLNVLPPLLDHAVMSAQRHQCLPWLLLVSCYSLVLLQFLHLNHHKLFIRMWRLFKYKHHLQKSWCWFWPKLSHQYCHYPHLHELVDQKSNGAPFQSLHGRKVNWEFTSGDRIHLIF